MSCWWWRSGVTDLGGAGYQFTISTDYKHPQWRRQNDQTNINLPLSPVLLTHKLHALLQAPRIQRNMSCHDCMPQNRPGSVTTTSCHFPVYQHIHLGDWKTNSNTLPHFVSNNAHPLKHTFVYLRLEAHIILLFLDFRLDIWYTACASPGPLPILYNFAICPLI